MTVLSPTMTIAGVLSRRGIRTDEHELAGALERALGRYLNLPGSAPLADSERAALSGGGLDLDGQEGGEPYAAAVSRTAADYAALVATSLSVAEAATRLDVDGSRVRHRIRAGELWALTTTGGRRLLPAIQFAADGGVVPGLSEVLRALPNDLHPLEVSGFLGGRTSQLRLRGREQSPVEWLLRGGAVASVAELATGVRDRLL